MVRCGSCRSGSWPDGMCILQASWTSLALTARRVEALSACLWTMQPCHRHPWKRICDRFRTSRTARCLPHLLKWMPLWVCFGACLCTQLCAFRSQTERRRLNSAIVSTSRPVADHSALTSPAVTTVVSVPEDKLRPAGVSRVYQPAGPPSTLQVHAGSLMSQTCTMARVYKAHSTCRPVGDHSICLISSMQENRWYMIRVSESLMTHFPSSADATNLPSGENTGVGPLYW